MTNTEIQVGEYVRTNNVRGIRKVARINEEATVNKYLFIDGYDHSDTIYGIIRADQITKHSFNLIDIIEEGDYVNGDKVDMLTEIGGEKVVVCNDYNLDDSAIIYNDKRIKSIVTKEQFKSMEYKVGGEDD